MCWASVSPGVHRRLTDPRHAGSTVAAIAYASGFRDISTFNRAFRQQFGMTPSDARAGRNNGVADASAIR